MGTGDHGCPLGGQSSEEDSQVKNITYISHDKISS